MIVIQVFKLTWSLSYLIAISVHATVPKYRNLKINNENGKYPVFSSNDNDCHVIFCDGIFDHLKNLPTPPTPAH